MTNRPITGRTGAFIEGYDELRRELRKLEGGLDDLKKANRQASELVVSEAAARGRELGGVARHVIERGSLRASNATTGATVLLGGAAAKHGPAFGAEFGARYYPQFKPWRGSDEGAGYFLWPTIRSKTTEIVDTYGALLDELTAKAFPDP